MTTPRVSAAGQRVGCLALVLAICNCKPSQREDARQQPSQREDARQQPSQREDARQQPSQREDARQQSITDKVWTTAQCPNGVCRWLLLRADGTYQRSHILTQNNNSLHCSSGVWSHGGTGETIQLRACDGSVNAVALSIQGGSLLFDGVSYEVDKGETASSQPFFGCNFKHFCDGASCGETMDCVESCQNEIIPGADPECPARCIGRISPSHQHKLDALNACLRKSGCGDLNDCKRACAPQFQSCD